jgi:ketosteroid isomerase-like protein
MPEENAEVVVRMIEAWARGDRESARATYDPDAVMILPVIDTPMMHGMVAIERGLELWRRSWEGYETEVEEVIPAEDGVLVVVRQHGIGKDTGAKVELLSYGVHTLRDSRIIRAEWFGDRDEALEAAGLSG